MHLDFLVKKRILILTRRFKKTVNELLGFYPKYDYQYFCRTENHGLPGNDWTICPQKISHKTIVYSFGIGEDLSFDLSLIKKYGLKIYAFDPTPKSLFWLKKQKLPKNLKVYPWGLSDHDGLASFFPPENPENVSYRIKKSKKGLSLPVFRLKTIMGKLGHKRVDVLKLDIEGTEYSVLKDILSSGIKVNQILVEFHHRFSGCKKEDTQKIVRKLNKQGYLIFHISDNGDEYSFIRLA